MIMVWTPPHQLQHQHQHLAPGCLGLRMDGASTCGTHAALSNKVRTPTTARPLRGVGIPSRTLSRIALHAVHDDSRSRRVVRKSLCFGKRSFMRNEPQHPLRMNHSTQEGPEKVRF